LKTLFWPISIAAVVIICDQVTKCWAVAVLTDQPSLQVIGDFVMLTLIYNEGGAMGTNLGASGYYLAVSVIILPLLFYYVYCHRHDSSLTWPLAFITGGAIGNLIDRIRLGRVIDFIDMDFFNINFLGHRLERWWTFNLADACISVAIVYLMARLFLVRPQKRSEAHVLKQADSFPTDEPQSPQRPNSRSTPTL